MSGQLCADDVVARKSDPARLAVVERTYSDVDTHDPYPGRTEGDKINYEKDIPKAAVQKFMTDGVPPRGTVLVRWQHAANPSLTPESKLLLVDRSLLIGDVVKKIATDATSGIVINTFTKCALQPVCSVSLRADAQRSDPATLMGLPPSSGAGQFFSQDNIERPPRILDVPSSELMYAECPAAEDLAIYKDWVARVGDCLTMITIKLSDNGVVEIRDDDAEHLNGAYDVFCIGDIVTSKKGLLRSGTWIYGRYNPNTTPVGTVVAVRVISASVEWLDRRISDGGGERRSYARPPTELERDELESEDFSIYNRTRRPAKTHETAASAISNSEIDVRLNLRVRFKDLSGACVKYDGSEGKSKLSRIDRRDTLGYDLNVYDVVNFQTEVEVQWQDLTTTRERSIDLVPELANDDEHDAWPAELVHPIELESVDLVSGTWQTKKVGVVQKVNPAERMAQVRWCPDSYVKYSVDPGEAGGFRSLVERRICPAEGEVEEVSLYDVEAPGELNVRRGDIALVIRPPGNAAGRIGGINWLGEVVDTRLDGTLTIRLGASNPVRDIHVRREDVVIAIRSDGTDEMDWEGAEDFGQSVQINSDGEIEVFDDEDSMFGSDDDDTCGGGSDMESEEAQAHYEDENGVQLDEEDVNDEQWESESDDVQMLDAKEETPLTSQSDTPPPAATKRNEHPEAGARDDQTPGPDQYAVLSTPVPRTHAFFLDPPSSSPGHMKRTGKEHRILRAASNLPPGVYVRTWESRLDLLRVLFIGPADTPYANAPLIVDFHLPSSFPTDPPQAFFHSWIAANGLGGVGRINPNLYEDGKICLSLLGTWESGGRDSTEGWNASRSTLLQVIVSILGLVLVKEPYFNEAGYEPLAGLDSSKRASEIYSERVYLKARTFVLAALDGRAPEQRVRGVQGLEDVLEWTFRSPAGSRLLERNIEEMEAILQTGDGGLEDGERAAGMSKGAKIALGRILERLKQI